MASGVRAKRRSVTRAIPYRVLGTLTCRAAAAVLPSFT